MMGNRPGRNETINEAQWKQVEQAFEAVVGLLPQERDAVLDEICPPSDPNIRALVMDLLEADESAGQFLEDSPLGERQEQILLAFAGLSGTGEHNETETAADRFSKGAAEDCTAGVKDLRLGDLIDDRYRLDEILGEGGMGTVYRATQTTPIERSVAVKVIKFGMDTRRVIARFEIERQALAVMNHTNIARIFDTGATKGGRPYFVMELAPGPSITEYCNEAGFDVDARLKLFLDICDAVQHAHQKGIIHRDLKPNNVIVTELDGRPVVKVIDFGIAKATGGSAAEHTLTSEAGMVLGTPAYMSPEQIDGGFEVDTRTDVYALGLVLYELLTGGPAFNTAELRKEGLAKMLATIREVNLERPSTRAGRAAPRSPADSSVLRRRLRGDLDWIVMKALAREPEHRYETARALAQDIRRHLANQPVHAGPPSTAYVLGKFVRRKKRLLVVASAFLVLIVSAVVALYQTSQEAVAARDEAALQLSISNIERGRLLVQSGDIGAAEKLIWREFLNAPHSLHTYWALWESFMQSRCVATVTGHAGSADELDIDDRGTVLVSAGDDGRVVIRDPSSLRLIGELDGTDSEIRALAVSPDGQYVAAGGAAGIIVVWKVATLEPVVRWQASEHELLTMDFSPDSQRLVSCGGDGVVRLWEARTGNPIAVFDHDSGPVAALRFSPDGSLVATGHAEVITLWDGASTLPQRVFPTRDRVHSLAFSHDGRLLAGGGQEQRIDVWELASGSPVATFMGSNSTVRSIVFAPDDQTLYSGCWYSIDRWSLSSGERLWKVPISSSVWGLVVDPDGRYLTASFGAGDLRRWEVDRAAGMHRMPEGGTSRAAAFGPDYEIVFGGDDQGRIRTADLRSGKILMTRAAHESGIRSLVVSHDGARLASASGDGVIRVSEAVSGALICAVDDGHVQTSRAIDLDDAGRRLAYATTSGRFKVRTIANGHEVELRTSSEAESLAIAFSPDGASLATISRDRMVRFWTTAGKSLGDCSFASQPWTMAYSPDGTRLALGLWDRSARSVNLADRSVEATLEGHGGTVWSIAFKPDDPRILASAASDGTVRLWDTTRQIHLATIPVAPNRDVHTVSFAPDGMTLLAAGEFEGPVWYDLTHFDRHIAGSVEYQIERFGDDVSDERANELRELAAEIMKRPWPRFRSRARVAR